MNVFDECVFALDRHVSLCNHAESKVVLDIINKFLASNPFFVTEDYQGSGYKTIKDISELRHIFKDSFEVFVIADSQDVPVFKADFHSVLDNFYDVAAISTKLFFLSSDKNYIFTVLFPHDYIRYAKLKI